MCEFVVILYTEMRSPGLPPALHSLQTAVSHRGVWIACTLKHHRPLRNNIFGRLCLGVVDPARFRAKTGKLNTGWGMGREIEDFCGFMRANLSKLPTDGPTWKMCGS